MTPESVNQVGRLQLIIGPANWRVNQPARRDMSPMSLPGPAPRFSTSRPTDTGQVLDCGSHSSAAAPGMASRAFKAILSSLDPRDLVHARSGVDNPKAHIVARRVLPSIRVGAGMTTG